MLMLQTMLADRFKLVLHREERAIPGYRLVLGKSGLKVRASAPDRGSAGHSQRGRIEAEVLQQPVLDATGTAAKFDLKLEFTPDDSRTGNPEPGGPSIFAALQEQLRLKLESGRVPSEVLVIDSAEKPFQNCEALISAPADDKKTMVRALCD
jgi:hypothetical protein